MYEKKRVLVISSSQDMIKTIKESIPSTKYTITPCPSILQAKQLLNRQNIQYCICVSPLKDENVLKGIKEIAKIHSIGILMIVKNDMYDQMAYQLKEQSVFVISFPTSKRMIYQSLELLDVMNDTISKANAKIVKLQTRMNEMKIINRAKLLLIEQYHYTEDKAHAYIEKSAMNSSKTKVDIAKSILEMKD